VAGTLATLRIGLFLDTTALKAGLASAQSQIATAGTALNTAVGLGSVAVAVGMAKAAGAAMEWEDAMAGVKRTTIDANKPLEVQRKEMDQLEESLLNLTHTIPITHAEIAEMARQAGALGVPVEQVDEFVQAVATMSELSDDLSPDMAATYFGKIRTVIGLANEDFMRLTSTIVGLGISGASTEGEILHMSQRFAGTASAVGLSAAEMAGWAAAMANVGEQSEAGGSTLQRLFLIVQRDMVAGGNKLQMIADAAGMTGEAFKTAFRDDASGAIKEFLNGLSHMDQETRSGILKDVGLGDIRLTRGLNAMIAAIGAGLEGNLNDALVKSNQYWEDQEQVTKMAETRWGTTSKRLQLLSNDFETMAIKIGEGLLPAIGLLIDGLELVAEWGTSVAVALGPLMGIISPLIAGLSALFALKFASRIVGMLLPGTAGSAVGTAWAGFMEAAIVGPISRGFGAAKGLIVRGMAALSGVLFDAFATMAMRGGIVGSIGTMLANGVLAGPRGLLASAASKLGLTFGTAFALAAAGVITKVLLDKLGDQFSQIRDMVDKMAKAPAAIPGALSLEELNKQLATLDKQMEGLGTTDADKNLLQFAADATSFLTNQPHVELGTLRANLQKQRAVIVQEIAKIQSGARDAAADPKARHLLFSIFNPDEAAKDVVTLGQQIMRGAQTVVGNVELAVQEAMVGVVAQLHDGFQLAKEEVVKGFGNIKDALKNPPMLIPKQQRLKNMTARMVKVQAMLAKATKAKDPASQRYWSNAVLNLQGKMDRLRGTHVADMKDIQKAHKDAGIKIVGTWRKTGQSMVRHAQRAARDSFDAILGLKTDILSMNLYSAGFNLVKTLAEGMKNAVDIVQRVVNAAGQTIADFLKGGSPPKRGPLSTIDQWGAPIIRAWAGGLSGNLGPVRAAGEAVGGAFHPRVGMTAPVGMGMGRGGTEIHIHGNVYGGPQGLRDLDRQIRRAVRLQSRER